MSRIGESAEPNDWSFSAEYLPLEIASAEPPGSGVFSSSLPSVVLEGSLATASDVDVFRIRLRAGDVITLDVDNGLPGTSDVDTVLWLGDAALNRLAESDDSGVADNGSVGGYDPYITYTAQASGDFYVSLSAYAQSGYGRYQLNFTIQSAPLTLAGGTVSETLAGWYGNDSITGSGGNDTLRGIAGNDTLRGGDGNDSLDGGRGNDSMAGDLGADTMFGDEGADRLLGGDANDTLDGGADLFVDTLDGGAGNDVLGDYFGHDLLQGGLGNDTLESGYLTPDTHFASGRMNGGDGDDLLRVHGRSDAFGDLGNDRLEWSWDGFGITAPTGSALLDGGAGSDILALDMSRLIGSTDPMDLVQFGGGSGYARKDGIEIRFTGIERFSIVGSVYDDRLQGAAGADTLNGYAGKDTLIGAAGNDLYVVEGADDMIIELSGGGIDAVWAPGSYSLVNLGAVENLRLTGASAANGTGNALANVLYAGAGDNVLDGLGGTDTVSYRYAGAAVTATLATTAAQATGGSGLDTLRNLERLTGSSFADRLTGNAGANELDGGAGRDTLTGGAGNDSYRVDRADDVVVEAASGGTDTVIATAGFSLAALPAVENLRLATSASANGTGNALGNVLYAGAGNNVLDGREGTDTVSYADALAAVTVSLGITTAQATGGSATDTLLNLERVAGSRFDDRLTGNADANRLDGGDGSDRLTGGAGADGFVLRGGVGSDTITDFASGIDKLLVDRTTLSVGDGDALLEGAVSVAGPGGFAPSAELVVVGGNIVGSITAASAAARIGSATSAYALGQDALFIVDNGSSSALYRFTSGDTDALVEAGELKLLAVLSGTAATSVADVLLF